ncbi:MAG: hypothetical protein ACRDGB_02640 [Candidatus Limnocylindria bacterium]
MNPRTRNVLLSVHITATVGTLGADLALLVLGLAGLSGSDTGSVYPAMYLIGSSIMSPLVVLSLGTGLVLALRTRWGLLRYWWVTLKLAITALLTVLVLLVLVPRMGAAAQAVGVGAGPTSAEQMQLVVAPIVGSTLLIATIALAVFKPSWQVPRRKVVLAP